MTKKNKLTPKQKRFVDKYLETGNGTRSALEAYDTEDYNTAHSIASENLQKPTIMAYLEQKGINAANRVIELSRQSDNLTVALNASKDILDRAYGKPQRTIDIISKGENLGIVFDLSIPNNQNSI